LKIENRKISRNERARAKKSHKCMGGVVGRMRITEDVNLRERAVKIVLPRRRRDRGSCKRETN